MDKLTVLGEGAKYDVSCSSSGADRSNIGRIGSAACAGICHSWAADGRCISLLKVLLSNDCAYDCKYCVNRRSAGTARRTFEPHELADLTIEFYRRNYIEGLFLSSAVLLSPDHTAERMHHCLWLLREEYGFAGYIHAKVIPGTSPEILHRIGLVADRLSVNVELPSENSLSALAPQKHPNGIFGPMRQITETQMEQRTLSAPGFMGKFSSGAAVRYAQGRQSGFGTGGGFEKSNGLSGFEAPFEGDIPSAFVPRARQGRSSGALADLRRNYKEKFAPAGQTTQMIIGATPESDLHIIKTSEALYRRFQMKRVYFSAYIPLSSAEGLPDMTTPPPLKREHRLYQADWLIRFYDFRADEILSADEPNLDCELDPKAVWALRHLEMFPIEINKASLEELLRIPGVGNTSATRILRQRRIAAVRYEDLKKIGVVLKRARFFLTCSGKYYGESEFEPYYIRDQIKERNAGALLAPPHTEDFGQGRSGTAKDSRSLLASARGESLQSMHNTSRNRLLDRDKIRGNLIGGAGAQISMFEALQV